MNASAPGPRSPMPKRPGSEVGWRTIPAARVERGDLIGGIVPVAAALVTEGQHPSMRHPASHSLRIGHRSPHALTLEASMSNDGRSAGAATEKLSLDRTGFGALERYRRAVNYLAAARIYLRENALLEQ